MKREIICGIYCFENMVNNKKYIGKSIDILRRIVSHKIDLRKNKDVSTKLQRAWNKYGEENFKQYIIEVCDEEDLDRLEKRNIEKFDSVKNGYNIGSGGGKGNRGIKYSKEARKKISDSILNNPERMAYLKEKWGGENNPNWGKPLSEEIKKKMILTKKIRNPIKTKNKRSISEIKIASGDTSIYIGVSFRKERNKWRAYLSVDKKQVFIGYYENEIDAAIARDDFCWEKYENLNLLNFPERYY